MKLDGIPFCSSSSSKREEGTLYGFGVLLQVRPAEVAQSLCMEKAWDSDCGACAFVGKLLCVFFKWLGDNNRREGGGFGSVIILGSVGSDDSSWGPVLWWSSNLIPTVATPAPFM